MKNRSLLLMMSLLMILSSSVQAEIKAGQGIVIRVTGVPAEESARISGPCTVSDAGTVRMALVGEVSIAGMSANAAAAKLEAIYKSNEIYTNPTFQISTTMTDSGVLQEMVTISGFVRAPGAKPMSPGLTLFQAVANGGGATEFGDMKRVMLMRGKISRVYNLNNMQDRNIPLQAGDTIDVPEKSLNPFR